MTTFHEWLDREQKDPLPVFAASAGLEIKHNNLASNDPCEFCGERTDPCVGPELFAAGSWALVCHQCGDAMLERGDVEGAAVWKRIVKAVEEVQRKERREGEAAH